jgi:hypothetical protein
LSAPAGVATNPTTTNEPATSATDANVERKRLPIPKTPRNTAREHEPAVTKTTCSPPVGIGTSVGGQA